MRTLLPDPPPAGLQAALDETIARRRAWGADTHDEVWCGVLHMNPAPSWRHANLQAQLMELLGPPARAADLATAAEVNVGDPDDYRVPDGVLMRPGTGALWNATAALVIEVLSPGDEAREKLPFYAARGVDEVLMVDDERRSVEWLGLADGAYRPVQRSGLVDLGPTELEQRLAWPD